MLDARRTVIRSACLAAALFAVSLTACKDTDDARAAAAQLAATTDALTGYYTSLHTLTVQTDQLNALEKAIVQTQYDSVLHQLLLDREKQLGERIALAQALSAVAHSLSALTAAKSADDASAAAEGLAKQVDSMTPLANPTEFHSLVASSLAPALHLLVERLQAHKDREAAQALDATVKALAELFRKESPGYTEIQLDAVQESETLAQALVRRGQVDATAAIEPALAPLGLTARLAPSAADPSLPQRLQPVLTQQIQQRGAALDASSQAATGAMQASLDELVKRVHLVALGSPMRLRLKPPALSTVERWSAGVAAAVPAAP